MILVAVLKYNEGKVLESIEKLENSTVWFVYLAQKHRNECGFWNDSYLLLL